ncbi:MAG: hypothetical protein WBM90_11640 [Acidimicrobiia bacterium]
MRTEALYTTEQAYLPGTTEFVELYEGALLQMFRPGGEKHPMGRKDRSYRMDQLSPT